MNIISTIEGFINNTLNKINEIAVDTGFKKRKGKLKAGTFVTAFTVGQAELHEVTLDTIASKCEELQKDLSISKQAILQRTRLGAEVLKEVYSQLSLEITNNCINIETMDVLKQFVDIKLSDGTVVSIADKMKNVYKGLGGKNSVSAVKLQVTYSVLKHEFVAIDDFSATKNDCTYNETILEMLQPGELSVKDMGYFDGDHLEKIDNKNAYFISRIKTNCVLYEKIKGEYRELDIVKLLKESCEKIDGYFFIKKSNGEMFRVRVTGLKLPQKVTNNKKRKAHKKAKSKGKQLTEREITLLDWFIVITNVPQHMLSVETIIELYRLRWQLELQFKALKGSLDFDNFGKAGGNYFKCLFYGKLIIVLLTMRLFSVCSFIKFKENCRRISIQKFVKNFRNNLKIIITTLTTPNRENMSLLEETVLRVAKRSLFDKRIRKTTFESINTQHLQDNEVILLNASGF